MSKCGGPAACWECAAAYAQQNGGYPGVGPLTPTPIPKRRTHRKTYDLSLLTGLAADDLRKRMDGHELSPEIVAWLEVWAARAWDLGWAAHGDGALPL